MTNLCALVISVFLRPVSTRRRRWTHKEPLTDKLQVAHPPLHISNKPHFSRQKSLYSSKNGLLFLLTIV